MKFQPWIVERRSLSKRSRVWRSIIRTVEHAWHGKVQTRSPHCAWQKDKAAKHTAHGSKHHHVTASPASLQLLKETRLFKYTLPLFAATKKSLVIIFSCPATTLTTRLTKHLIAFPHLSSGVGQASSGCTLLVSMKKKLAGDVTLR